MTGLSSRNSKAKFMSLWALAVLAAGGLTVFGSGPVRAAEDDVPLDTKLFRSFMSGLGLRDDRESIDYHERSPLVIPPNKALPAPEKAGVARNPNWPVDQEARQQREIEANSPERKLGASDAAREVERVLRPDELNPPRRRTRSATNGTQGDQSYSGDFSRLLKPSELGTKNGLFGGIFGEKDESAPFTGEPPRASLIAPPTGYQTPSPSQPYGVGQDQYIAKPSTLDERLEAAH